MDIPEKCLYALKNAKKEKALKKVIIKIHFASCSGYSRLKNVLTTLYLCFHIKLFMVHTKFWICLDILSKY